MTRNIQSSYASTICFGDPVIKTASLQYVVLPGNGTSTAIEGIFYGCTYVPTAGAPPVWTPYFPGSTKTDATAYIISAPTALFRVAALLTSVPATAVGANINFTTGGLNGTAVGGGFSIYTVDQATLASTSTLPFQVYQLYPGVGNGSDPTTSYGWVICSFNNQRFRNNTGIL